ncbi:LLM class flavin-dependent oxidoreductase [Prauserella flavalba]|uniref:Luciferase-like domain-containing protein n=1 Tax=Prauserella flavalba TaxID=1477506 RepID=A0A318LSP3_9PSEU|nr:LLM class flavin-dependent oxidoreductase [Prauserella flavalba]PXY36334.1 hypothetical protein BA062_13045 [Prauserella flavalba]
MRIGIGLPAAIPGAEPTSIGRWAAESERCGFPAPGVIDRLVYDNLDRLAAAAASTRRAELLTTVLNIGYRRNPVVICRGSCRTC